MDLQRVLLAALALGMAGCNGDENPNRTSANEGGGLTGLTGAGTSGADAEGSDAADGATGEGSGAEGADGADAAEAGDDDGPKFDIGASPDGGVGGCADGDGGGGGMGGDLGFSYIWIANTPQGSVSKIDTRTGVEEGRYYVGDSARSPSRTSVNQFGDVAVGDRLDSPGTAQVQKIAAQLEDCVESNGVPGIQTSTGPMDILPFGQDECVLWSVGLPVVDRGPRAIAWEGGQLDPVTCQSTVPNPRLWVGYGNSGTNEVYRLDGATGAELDHITIPSQGWVYGGAVNSEGDLFMAIRNGQKIVHVDAVTLDWQAFDVPVNPYGIGVDANGDPWVVAFGAGNGAYRIDMATGMPVSANGTTSSHRGMNFDRVGRNWVATNNPCRLSVYDGNTDSLIQDDIPLPGCATPVGVSIDFDGFVWVVDQAGIAFKVNPDTYAVDLTVSGLSAPYTYSDMTGAGLNLVINPPG